MGGPHPTATLAARSGHKPNPAHIGPVPALSRKFRRACPLSALYLQAAKCSSRVLIHLKAHTLCTRAHALAAKGWLPPQLLSTAEAAKLGAVPPGWECSRSCLAASCAAASASNTLARCRIWVTSQHFRLLRGLRQERGHQKLVSSRACDPRRAAAAAWPGTSALALQPAPSAPGDVYPDCVADVAVVLLVVRLREVRGCRL